MVSEMHQTLRIATDRMQSPCLEHLNRVLHSQALATLNHPVLFLLSERSLMSAHAVLNSAPTAVKIESYLVSTTRIDDLDLADMSSLH